MDFTIKTYKQLLAELKKADYNFQPLTEFVENPAKRSIILRHDVEKYYENALNFAQIESNMGIKGIYYFRFSKQYYNEFIIEKIVSLGHEIGYHYDDLAKCKGNYQSAIERFENNLSQLRAIAPVTSICMDGSPLSKHDNKSLWEKYNYRDFEISTEPYFDINFNDVMYLTDTGRRRDGEKVSVRDKVKSTNLKSKIHPEPRTQNPEPKTQNLFFHSSNDIIQAAKAGKLPNKIMFTFHPQRWTDNPLLWMKELVWQNMKNLVKRIIVTR